MSASKKNFPNKYFISLKYYIAILAIIGLCLYASIIVLLTSVVHKNYTPQRISSFLKHPLATLSGIRKAPLNFNGIAVDELPNRDRVEQKCIKLGCYLLLKSENYDPDIIIPEDVEEPTRIGEVDGDGYVWIIPAQITNDSKDLASEVGTIIWDETRQIIIYKVSKNSGGAPINKLFIRDYNKFWGFGLLHWVDLQLPANNLEVTSYDQAKGMIAFDHYDPESNKLVRKSYFSVSDPILYSEEK